MSIRLYRRFARKRRFWMLVEVTSPDGCWPWRGALDAGGRPVFDGRPAYEQAYELARGQIPRGARVRPRCPEERCMNPEHMDLLEAV